MKNINDLLAEMLVNKASDLYLTYGHAPAFRIKGRVQSVDMEALDDEFLQASIDTLIPADKIPEFEDTMELNTALNWQDRARFRINAYRQQQHNALVIRRINTEIPSLDELKLPEVYQNLIMQARGLVLLVGATGSGKSTSMASMVDYRNANSSGHIITIEDPIEYLHHHKGCIISQRDVGIDTYSFGMALKNALRQQPDLIVIGEIRDAETMEHAINFSETGHLCLATLHANNANHAIERILSFFPEERRAQMRLSLANNLRGILGQRLVDNVRKERSLVSEIMLNEGLIRTLIIEEKLGEIKEIMANNRGNNANGNGGMQTFDQVLYDLVLSKDITEEVALKEADNIANLRLRISQSKPNNLGSTPFFAARRDF